MIYKIWSNLESFKTIRLHAGLNVLLADKSENATDKQSRNGAGKTSFVELVHYLFGADLKAASIFRSDALKDATFYADIEIGGVRGTISRSCKRPSSVGIDGPLSERLADEQVSGTIDHGVLAVPAESSAESAPSWNDTLVASSEQGLFMAHRKISNEKWKNILGQVCFGLPPRGESSAKVLPTFRLLFPFFARRQRDGGFHLPVQHTSAQQAWSQQVSISYLLGLDATIPQQFQKLKESERVVKALRKAVREGEVNHRFGTSADLRTKLTISEAHSNRLRTQIDAFCVVPQYRDLEAEADRITKDFNALSADNVADRIVITEFSDSIESEECPDSSDVKKVYHEAGIVLPGIALRQLAQVEEFHEAIVRNRQFHLQSEIESAKNRIKERERKITSLDDRRRQIMNILQSGGALEHYTNLREELGRVEGEIQALKERLDVTDRLELTQNDLALERSKLIKTLQGDIHEREDIFRDAILRFADLSRSLYGQGRAGSLTVSATASGPKFEARIDSERSKGIMNMQIFCFDMMLSETCASRQHSLGFLIHDSHLFDGVDERQVARALELGAQRSKARGFQYIVTMNTDGIPTEGFEADFALQDYAIDPRLTDATEDGGLFGIRFN